MSVVRATFANRYFMKLRQLRYFVSIVDAGSFSRAAQVAHVAQPALSQQIAELENQLGVSLLQRGARGVRATAAGRRLYAEARVILQRVERLPDIVRGQDEEIEGSCRVGMSSTLALILGGRIIAACRAALPKVRLQFTSASSAQLAARLRDQSLDLAVLFEDTPHSGLVHLPLFRRRLFVVSIATESVCATAVNIRSMAGMPLVLPSAPNITRSVLDREFEKVGLVPSVVAEVSLATDILGAVEAGVGNAVLPLARYDELADTGAFEAREIEPPIELTASMVSPADAALTGAGEAVREFICRFLLRHLCEQSESGDDDF
jgi:LysR family transcriptional regulator, nitrogen assimilation regulatory protein